jgi:hypothetical protein
MSACNYIPQVLYLPEKPTARPSRCWLDLLCILERKIADALIEGGLVPASRHSEKVIRGSAWRYPESDPLPPGREWRLRMCGDAA